MPFHFILNCQEFNISAIPGISSLRLCLKVWKGRKDFEGTKIHKKIEKYFTFFKEYFFRE